MNLMNQYHKMSYVILWQVSLMNFISSAAWLLRSCYCVVTVFGHLTVLSGHWLLQVSQVMQRNRLGEVSSDSRDGLQGASPSLKRHFTKCRVVSRPLWIWCFLKERSLNSSRRVASAASAFLKTHMVPSLTMITRHRNTLVHWLISHSKVTAVHLYYFTVI